MPARAAVYRESADDCADVGLDCCEYLRLVVLARGDERQCDVDGRNKTAAAAILRYPTRLRLLVLETVIWKPREPRGTPHARN